MICKYKGISCILILSRDGECVHATSIPASSTLLALHVDVDPHRNVLTPTLSSAVSVRKSILLFCNSIFFFSLVYSLVCKGSKHATLVLYFSIDTLFFPLAYNLRVWNCCEHLMAVYPTTTPCFKLVSAHMFACHRTRPSVPHAKGPSATDALTFRYQHTAP